MDYANPGAGSISVGFVQVPARGTAKDTVFMNPGGPSGDAYVFAGHKDGYWPEELNQDFTLVGVQPRGLEGSTPLTCTTETTLGLREACNIARPGYAETITTESNARDWNEVRKALGLETISLLGASYGTFLASVYATEFPQHTNRVVLDSGGDVEDTNRAFAQEPAAVATLHYFFDWVARNNDTYGLGTTPYAVYRQWAEAIRRDTGAYPPAAPPPRTAADLPPQSTSLGQGVVRLFTAVDPALTDAEAAITHMRAGTKAAESNLYAATLTYLQSPSVWDQLAEGITDPLIAQELM